MFHLENGIPNVFKPSVKASNIGGNVEHQNLSFIIRAANSLCLICRPSDAKFRRSNSLPPCSVSHSTRTADSQKVPAYIPNGQRLILADVPASSLRVPGSKNNHSENYAE